MTLMVYFNSHGSCIRVLLVEDNLYDQQAFMRHITSAHLPYECQLVGSIVAAQEVLERQRFDVIVLDYMLGDGTAFDLLEWAAPKKLTFIITTGHGSEEVAAQLVLKGAADYLVKDIRCQYLEVLPGIIDRVLRRKQADAQIHCLTHTLRHIQDSVYIVNESNELIFINHSLSELCGIDEHDAIGQSIAVLGQPELADYVLNSQVDMPLADGDDRTAQPVTIELAITYPDRRLGCVSLSESYLHVDEQRIRVGVMRDVTHHKQAQQALRESEQRYSALASLAPVGIFVADLQGNCRYVNQRLCELTGLTSERACGLGWLDIFPPAECEKYYGRWRQAMQTEGRFVLEYRLQSVSQPDVWLLIQSVPQQDCQGNVVSYIASVTDISARKQSEVLLQRTNQALLNATKLKDEFLANMSHELRTPLNVILGVAESLQTGILGSINPRQTKALQMLDQSAMHLLDLINNILDLSKVSAGKIELECELTSIQQLCRDSLAFVQQQALNKGIELRLMLHPEVESFPLDVRRMQQVLINLLTNAVKFTPEPGEVTLEVGMLPTAMTERSKVYFRVSDTGVGIPPEYMHKLFQPFMQIDGALNRQYNGTGLGLSLVKRLVDLHGGDVTVKSQVNVGSQFEVILPWSLSSCRLASPSQPLTPLHSSRPTIPRSQRQPLILLADDNELNVSMIVDYLQANGFRLITTADGETAISLAEFRSPDLILMDIQMPGMDGLEAIQQIRQRSTMEQLPIIALTALAMEGDRERCLAAGANRYVTKPVCLKELVTMIEDCLSDNRVAEVNSVQC